MSDIVERLNSELGWGIGPAGLCQEAAAEIVKLRRERDEARARKDEIIASLAAQVSEATVRGYRRGVEDAAGAAKEYPKVYSLGVEENCRRIHRAILALLEKDEPSLSSGDKLG